MHVQQNPKLEKGPKNNQQYGGDHECGGIYQLGRALKMQVNGGLNKVEVYFSPSPEVDICRTDMAAHQVIREAVKLLFSRAFEFLLKCPAYVFSLAQQTAIQIFLKAIRNSGSFCVAVLL